MRNERNNLDCNCLVSERGFNKGTCPMRSRIAYCVLWCIAALTGDVAIAAANDTDGLTGWRLSTIYHPEKKRQVANGYAKMHLRQHIGHFPSAPWLQLPIRKVGALR
jgi:hypothetical protein